MLELGIEPTAHGLSHELGLGHHALRDIVDQLEVLQGLLVGVEGELKGASVVCLGLCFRGFLGREVRDFAERGEIGKALLDLTNQGLSELVALLDPAASFFDSSAPVRTGDKAAEHDEGHERQDDEREPVVLQGSSSSMDLASGPYESSSLIGPSREGV